MIASAESELRDHYFQYWIHDHDEFFTIPTVKSESRVIDSSTLASVKVRLDQKSETYVRRADTIFNGLESVGGFYESLHYIGVFIVFYFRDRLFHSSFLRQLYQVDAERIPPRV